MPRTSKKITTQKIVPQALTPKVVKARPMIQFGTGSSRGCFGESVTCEKVASLILTCPDIQAAINAVSSPDIFIVSVVPTALPGVFTANLSDGTSFTIDLSSLVENQTLSLSNGLLTISEGNTIDLCPVISYCITNNGLPAGVDLFTLNGTTITTGSTHNLTLDSNANTIELEVDGVTVSTAPIVNSNVLSSAGLTLTSTVNGVADSEDLTGAVQALITSNTDSVTNTVAGHLIATHTAVDNTVVNINETITSLGDHTLVGTVLGTPYTDETGTTIIRTVDLAPLMSSAIFQSDDDQVLTAGAASDMDVQLVPTIVADPDSQVNKTNYEISITPKPTVICSGNPLSATNKFLTSDTLTTNVTVPTNIVAQPDPLTEDYVQAVKVNTGCNEDIYVPIVQPACADLTAYQEGINDPLPLNSYTDVVPTAVSSLAAAQASVVDKTIIVEVVNTGNPCENGVYAIEPNGDTKKITDPSIFYKDGSNNVFKNTCANLPILSTATTEPMAIDTATGQIGRVFVPNNIYSRIFNPLVNIIDSTTGASTFTEITRATQTVNLVKTTNVHGSYSIDLESSDIIESLTHLIYGLVFLDGSYASMATVRYMTSDISNSGGVKKCMQIHGDFAMNVTAGVHTIGFGYVLNNGSTNNIISGSASVQHVEKTILFS